VIAVVGLLLTTGGYDGIPLGSERSGAGQVTEVAAGVRATEKIDARLIPLADLQAQGGTPTLAASDARSTPGSGDRGDVAEVVPTQRTTTDRVRDTICSYPWPQGCEYWIAIFFCEATLDPTKDTNWPYVGLGQIDVELHHDLILSMGYTVEDMYLAAPNLAVSWRLSHEGTRTSPWPWCQWQ
jgi:hypothetical protein